jgi:hypothetical protein
MPQNVLLLTPSDTSRSLEVVSKWVPFMFVRCLMWSERKWDMGDGRDLGSVRHAKRRVDWKLRPTYPLPHAITFHNATE